MERLREEPAPHLGTDARSRVLRHLTDLPPSEPSLEPRQFRLGRPILAFAACLLVASSLWVWRGGASNPAVEVSSRATSIRARAAGVLASAGAQISYQAGAEFHVQPERREVQLLAGEIDVDVVPGGPGRFRVVTPRFTIEVLGTRFVVHMDGVRTLHGVVRVVDSQGRELAMVQAGQSWKIESLLLARAGAEAVRPGAPLVSPPDSAEVRAPRNQRRPGRLAMHDSATGLSNDGHARPPAEAPSEGPSVDSLLAEARILLATGDTSLARERIATALQAHPTPRQQASAALLTANSLLAERRYGEALLGFRRTANLFGSQPEGELAIFALAQLQSEQGLKREVQTTYRQYLERYPSGRFVDEVRRKLTLPPAPNPVQDPLHSP
jgi:TolA-binding protein